MSPWLVSHTCLFLINGLGLGNSTRCHAVIERLAEAGCRVHVVTSGNGLAYFESKPCVESVSPMDSFYYSGTGKGISGWSTLKSLLALLKIAKAKRAQIERVLGRVQPGAVVIDSEYALSPVRRRGIPIIGLNTSEMVVTEYLRHRHAAPGIRSHFWFVEFTDYLFHRHYCDLVLSPFPLRTPTRHPRFRRIGLIVRKQVQERVATLGAQTRPSPRELKRVVFMLSGSVHASLIPFSEYQLPFQVDVVGRTGNSTAKVVFHGRKMDNTEHLLAADALVINGGYSAVSEAFLLRKPVFVVPVPGHAEQFVNAHLVHDLGLGFVASEANVLDQLLQMHAADKWFDLKPTPPAFELDGAREAAETILGFLKRPQAPVPAAG